jgi:single-stranded-DNA-specific exonuclease
VSEAVLGVTRSLSGRRWHWRDAGAERIGLGLAQRLGVPEIIGRVLAARGIGPETAPDFLAPTLRALLPDPAVLRDMETAATRLANAVEAGECVGLFGDYDVDGGCATALMAGLLENLGCPVLTHIPDRLREGYGPNAPALKTFVAQGARLILTLDCGTTSEAIFGEISGADIIVLDHHKADGPPPRVLATINPNRLDDTSGLGTLCATAVTFLAAIALVRTLRQRGFFAARETPDLMRALDLVALATVCDVMPLTGLNRALVSQGLKVMARRERPGLAALLDVAQVTEAPGAFTCGFVLGPRINAGGRIAEADLGLRLLRARDAREAQGLAIVLDRVNRERQKVEGAVLERALDQAGEQRAAGHAVLFVAGAEWHPGIVGIVAGRIKERFNRPACAGGLQDGVVKGSGRSLPGLDLGGAVIAARQAGILTAGGGHAMAAGFTLDAREIAAFQAFLDDRLAAAASLPDAADLAIEGTLSVAGADTPLAETLSRLAPFGPGNEEPQLALHRASNSYAKAAGRDGNTLICTVEDEAGQKLKAVLFRAGDTPLGSALRNLQGPPLHLAGHLRLNTWQGRNSADFTIIDAAPG